MGWVGVLTHRGHTMTGSRSVRYRTISKEMLPAPSTTAARSSTTGTPVEPRSVPTSWRLDRWVDRSLVPEAPEVDDPAHAGRGGALGERRAMARSRSANPSPPAMAWTR